MYDESIPIAECAVRRAIRADVPERRGVRGGSVPSPLAGRLHLPGLREQERGSAQAGALRPPVPRLQEADFGDGRDVHSPLARVAEDLVPGLLHHDLAFERDVGLAAAVPSGLGEIQVGLDTRAEDPLAMDFADGFPQVANVQADETGVPYRLKGFKLPPGGRSHKSRLDDRQGGRGVRGEQFRERQAPQDHGSIRPGAEGVRQSSHRSGNADRDRWLRRLRRAGEPRCDGGR